MRNTNGLGGKSTQKEIHTHIQTRGHYLYLYLYLLNQQNDLSLYLARSGHGLCQKSCSIRHVLYFLA